MPDNNHVVENLNKRKEEIEEELEFKSSKPLEDELYEIKDTLKKLKNE